MVKTVVKTKEMNETIPGYFNFTKSKKSNKIDRKIQYILMDEAGYSMGSNIKQRWEIIKKEINER
jgi:hypothetical protein